MCVWKLNSFRSEWNIQTPSCSTFLKCALVERRWSWSSCWCLCMYTFPYASLNSNSSIFKKNVATFHSFFSSLYIFFKLSLQFLFQIKVKVKRISTPSIPRHTQNLSFAHCFTFICLLIPFFCTKSSFRTNNAYRSNKKSTVFSKSSICRHYFVFFIDFILFIKRKERRHIIF